MINDQEDRELRMLIQQRTREMDQRFRQMESALQQKNDQIEQAQRQTEVDAYARRRRAELTGEIAPELLDYIGGSSIEAVEASIVRAKSKTDSIVAGLREGIAALPARPEVVQVQMTRPQPGQPSLEDLAAIEVGSPQHRAWRHAAGIDKGRGSGLFS